MPSRVSSLQPGTVFAGDYRVMHLLSEGGMGAVYVAEQLSTGKQRALKLMLPQLVADPRLRTRFEQEARIGSKIDSEHVIEVVAAGIDHVTGAPWLAMELLRGEDLTAYMHRHGPQSPRAMLEIMESATPWLQLMPRASCIGISSRRTSSSPKPAALARTS